MKIDRLIAALLLAAGVLCSPFVAAQDFPSRALRMIVPQPPGGGFDLIGRVV